MPSPPRNPKPPVAVRRAGSGVLRLGELTLSLPSAALRRVSTGPCLGNAVEQALVEEDQESLSGGHEWRRAVPATILLISDF